MKHIFILNPAAGKKQASTLFLPQIIKTAKSMEIDYEIHRTVGIGDGEHFVRSRCEAEAESDKKSILRFYACGGDGTFNEVVNGAFGFENAEVAMIPAGTGNDFVRNFDDHDAFYDIKRQILGKAVKVDLIRYGNRITPAKYGINMFNIGLDSEVVEKTASIKKFLISGSFSYALGVGIAFMQKEGTILSIDFDDGVKYEGEVLLVSIANGSYYGGGFKAAPYARLDDGFMDVSIVKNISRSTFLKLIGKYRNGTYLEVPDIEKIITYKRCKHLKITPKSEMKLCTDGELSLTGNTTFEIIPQALNFSVPIS
jgi:diacylglycerol kinase (ATP)